VLASGLASSSAQPGGWGPAAAATAPSASGQHNGATQGAGTLPLGGSTAQAAPTAAITAHRLHCAPEPSHTHDGHPPTLALVRLKMPPLWVPCRRAPTACSSCSGTASSCSSACAMEGARWKAR
jgi:hypothetical protein